MVTFLINKRRLLWQEARQFLSFFNLIRFCRYLSIIDECQEAENQNKDQTNVRLLFGNQANPNKTNIVDFSDYQLSDTEEFVLSLGFFHPAASNAKKYLLILKYFMFICFTTNILLMSNKLH